MRTLIVCAALVATPAAAKPPFVCHAAAERAVIIVQSLADDAGRSVRSISGRSLAETKDELAASLGAGGMCEVIIAMPESTLRGILAATYADKLTAD